jgi:hypothetical protein
MYTALNFQDSKKNTVLNGYEMEKSNKMCEKKTLFVILGVLFGFSMIGFTIFLMTKSKLNEDQNLTTISYTSKFSGSNLQNCNQTEGAFIQCYNEGICIQFECLSFLCLKCICIEVSFA